jgi:hypothetical protein
MPARLFYDGIFLGLQHPASLFLLYIYLLLRTEPRYVDQEVWEGERKARALIASTPATPGRCFLPDL